MFCIKSDVITLESIEMYGFVTVWVRMYDGPYWVILLMDGSYDIRHTGFPQVDGGQRDPQDLGCHSNNMFDNCCLMNVNICMLIY